MNWKIIFVRKSEEFVLYHSNWGFLVVCILYASLIATWRKNVRCISLVTIYNHRRKFARLVFFLLVSMCDILCEVQFAKTNRSTSLEV